LLFTEGIDLINSTSDVKRVHSLDVATSNTSSLTAATR